MAFESLHVAPGTNLHWSVQHFRSSPSSHSSPSSFIPLPHVDPPGLSRHPVHVRRLLTTEPIWCLLHEENIRLFSRSPLTLFEFMM